MVPEQSLFGTLEQQQAALIEECEILATDLGLTFRASGATTPHESIAVTATGTALPCCIAPFATTDYQQIMLGNVFERPLAEVWNDRPYQELRAAVLSEHPAPWPCQHCGVRWSL